jgi:prepilin-type N-terminal cleavage/methylation domain-containing protein
MRKQIQKPGFTLIEILIVIVIIAVMSAVVVPAYVRYLGHVRFQAKVKQVQDLFAYAREQAIALDTTVTLKYDKGSARFTVELPDSSPSNDQPSAFSNGTQVQDAHGQAAPPPRVVQLDPEQSVSNYIVSQGTNSTSTSANSTVQSGQNELHFQGDGTVETLDMSIAQSDGKKAHLQLWPATGKLTLDPGVASQ